MALGENIKKYRKEKKLTQKEMAKKINKSCSTFQKYELNLTQPPIDVIKEIADILEVSMVDLLYNPECDDNDTFFDAIEKEAEAEMILFKKEVLETYNKLNESGKWKVNEYIFDLSEIKRYTTPDEE